jgi:hypothetical protein
MHGINQIIKQAYTIFNTPEVPPQVKLHALDLIADCQQRRFDLSSSGAIIEQGIAYVESMRANVNNLVHSVPEDKVREMLHEELDSTAGDDDIVRDKSSDGTIIDSTDADIAAGIVNDCEAAVAVEESNQGDESLSLTDPNTNNNNSSSTDDNNNIEEDTGDTTDTTNTVF